TRALGNGKYPARNIPERLADLRAQVAAVQKGIFELNKLCNDYSNNVVTAYMGHIRNDARHAMQDVLEILLEGKSERTFEFTDYLDSSAKIKVCMRMSRNSDGNPVVEIDFTGTDAQLNSSLNAPYAVTYAAVLYVFRTLTNRPIPLNEGCLELIKIIIPERCLLNPSRGAAVCGGNVETSQRIVDCLYGALNAAAASQGTMNNIAFGNTDSSGSQYYETIAGGSGAVDGHHGASACQVHMTNTRITDPEIIEIRFPQIRLESFKIRENSGGQGRFRGGDGVIRAYLFLKPQSVSILSERRKYQPYGINGGKPGKSGKNLLIHPDGSIEKLEGHFQGLINDGYILEIRTPGGGGFGIL
ncbi:MAG: hydantoinase B/oxoprolinase family protein, partial [bacterium]